jgi:small GTP-binding protein
METNRSDGKLYELYLWDMAGQEDYDRLRPLSYPQTDVFMVVFSIINRASFENIRLKWNPELDKFVGPHVPRILVGLKKASRDNPEIVEGLRKHRSVPVRSYEGLQLAKEMQAYQYVECDALTRDNLDTAFEEVCAHIDILLTRFS